jgi:hypothetical protein
MQMIQRKEIRQKYRLDGDLCDDCWRASCCSCCEAIQSENEVKSRQEQREPMMAGYQKPPMMEYGGGGDEPPAPAAVELEYTPGAPTAIRAELP